MADPIVSSTQSTVPMTDTAVLQAPVEKNSGGFGRIMGGILGGPVNMVAPGLGSVLGGVMNSGANAADMKSMMDNQMRQSMQLLTVQNRVQSQSQEFTTFSNLLKSKHDSEMSAVSNFKS